MSNAVTYDIDMPEVCFDSAGFLLKNPNRGLRGETYITLGENLRAYPGDNVEPYTFAITLQNSLTDLRLRSLRNFLSCLKSTA